VEPNVFAIVTGNAPSDEDAAVESGSDEDHDASSAVALSAATAVATLRRVVRANTGHSFGDR